MVTMMRLVDASKVAVLKGYVEENLTNPKTRGFAIGVQVALETLGLWDETDKEKALSRPKQSGRKK